MVVSSHLTAVYFGKMFNFNLYNCREKLLLMQGVRTSITIMIMYWRQDIQPQATADNGIFISVLVNFYVLPLDFIIVLETELIPYISILWFMGL